MSACGDYIHKVVKYIWAMCAQDPPMVLGFDYKHGDEFDSTKLRSYTKGGNLVDFVVWPVMYLHKNGPLVAKGVAQGLKRSKSPMPPMN